MLPFFATQPMGEKREEKKTMTREILEGVGIIKGIALLTYLYCKCTCSFTSYFTGFLTWVASHKQHYT